MYSRAFFAVSLVFGAVACAAGSPPPGPAAPPAAGQPSATNPNAPLVSPPSEPPGAVAGHPGEPPGTVASGPDAPGGPFPGSTFRVRDLGVSVPDEWRSCSAASDCKLVVTTCCDHCNGGKAVAVNTAHVKDVEAKYPKSCNNVACTERGCATRAACQSSRCVLEWASAS